MKADNSFYLLLALTLAAFMVTGVGNAVAETRYVSDVMMIILRSEPNEDAEKIRMLRSDTPLEVIQESGEYLKVRTGTNEEGWVIKRYLTSAIPKSMIITELGQRINHLEEKNKELEKIRKDLEEELNEIKQYQNGSDEYKTSIQKEREDAAKAMQELEVLTQKYNELSDKSHDAVAMAEKIKILEEKIIKLSSSNNKRKELSEQYKQEKKDLFHADAIRWFLAGGGVLLVGILLGKISRKKDYY